MPLVESLIIVRGKIIVIYDVILDHINIITSCRMIILSGKIIVLYDVILGHKYDHLLPGDYGKQKDYCKITKFLTI